MTNSLPNWIERLLGLEAGAGEGTAWRLDSSWNWPPWLTLLAVGLAAVFVVVTYWRENPQASARFRMGLATVRLLALGAVLAMLAQFSLSLQRTGLPYVAVLVDDSLSMTIADRYDEPLRALLADRVRRAGYEGLSRWNLARTLLTERNGAFLSQILEDYKLRVYYLTASQAAGFGAEEIAGELRSREPQGENTRLGDAVRDVLDDLRGSPPAAMILLTDGINTDGPGLEEAAADARRKGVPLYFVGLGDDRPVKDIRLSDLLVDEVVFLHDAVYFEAQLSAVGFAGRGARIVLREKGKSEVLAQIDATLGPDGQTQPIRIPYRAEKEGEFHFVVEAEPQEGELQTDNNRQERTVRVRKEKIRVLLVQADPSFEFRYLRNMLARDNTVELKTLLQNADPEYPEQDSTALRGFPTSREELFRYDVVILSDANLAPLSPSMMQDLVDFVREPGKGGALVCIAGAKHLPAEVRGTPLERLMPLDVGSVRYPDADRPLAEGFSVEPTDLGLANPALELGDTPDHSAEVWRNLPPLYWMLKIGERKPAARVLAESQAADGRRWPIILLQYAGAGKVLFHATDETWRWRYRAGDVYFARYWVQMIRYLTRSKLQEGDASIALAADRREYRRGETVRLRARFADDRQAPEEDDAVTVVLEHPGRPAERIKLRRAAGSRGLFETEIDRLPIGAYHAWIATPSAQGRAPAADFTVLAPPGEFEHVRTDSQAMQRAAEQTKGKFYSFDNADRLVYELPEGRQVPVESLPPIPLWNTWPAVALVLALLVTEWLLRKLGGMV